MSEIQPADSGSTHHARSKIKRAKTYFFWWLKGVIAGDKARQFELIISAGAATNWVLAVIAPSPIGTLTNGLCAVVVSCLFAMHFWRPQYREASMWIMWATLHMGSTIGVFWQGGVWSISMAFFLSTTVAMVMVVNVKAVKVITAVTIITVAGLVWAESNGMMPPSRVPLDNLWWSTLLFICLVISIVTLPIVAYATQIQLAKSLSNHNRELRLAQSQLREQHRQQEQFVASVSHELRTPMNAIMGFLQSVDRHRIKDPDEQEMLDLMEVSSQQLLSRINELLDFSQLQAGKLRIRQQTFDITKEITSVVDHFSPLIRSKEVNLLTHIHSRTPRWVVGDAERITQVLKNLLSNAVKFTDRGQIIIAVEPRPGGFIRFSVTDTGIGIAAQEIDRIFNRLSSITSRTRKERGGTGLGLSITKALIQLMGGEIEVDSQVGKGSRFVFELPMEAMNHPQTFYAYAASLEAAIDLRGRVLLVDDSPVNRLVAHNLLKTDLPRIEILEAESGERAIEIVNQEPVNLVLMDVIMPGIGGIEAAKQILTHMGTGNITIIGLTADLSDDVSAQCLEAGMKAVLGKPFSRTSLCQSVRQVLSKPSASQRHT